MNRVPPDSRSRATRIPAGEVVLDGDLTLPSGASGVVLFAHGSGSSRHSPRNKVVASALVKRGFGTLLMDLLTVSEEGVDARTMHLRFDIRLLAQRLTSAVDWLWGDSETRRLPVGLFGASTGAAAALVAAAHRPYAVGAVVSRGGRPDLAGDDLPEVKCPTLLIVGELDEEVIGLNRDAVRMMRAMAEVIIVSRAGHLFEEPGALDEVAHLAGDWFASHLPRRAQGGAA